MGRCSQRRQGGLDFVFVSVRTKFLQASDLGESNRTVVDLKHVHFVFLFQTVFVGAHNGVDATVGKERKRETEREAKAIGN